MHGRCAMARIDDDRLIGRTFLTDQAEGQSASRDRVFVTFVRAKSSGLDWHGAAEPSFACGWAASTSWLPRAGFEREIRGAASVTLEPVITHTPDGDRSTRDEGS